MSSANPGWLQVFDHELRLLYSRRLSQAAGVLDVVAKSRVLILINAVGAPRWQLIGQKDDEFELVSSGSHVSLPRGANILAGAISPDGQYVVTSPATRRATISVWSAASGELLREVHPVGGFQRPAADFPFDYMLRRLAFSRSGKYLTASDTQSAYLFDFRQIIGGSLSPSEKE